MEPNFKKSFAIFVLFLLAWSAISIVHAETSIPKPAVPTFTVEFVDNSYDLPATSSIDPFSGQTVSHPTQHIENYTINIRIKNQPYAPILVHDGTSNWTASFYYNIRMKGHFETNWINLYSPDSDYPKKSDSAYTTLRYSSRGDNGIDIAGRTLSSDSINKIDFQVQALIGATHRGFNATATDQLQMYPYVFDGETSDWSNTQTVTIPEAASSTTPNSSSSPTQANPTINTGPTVNNPWGLSIGEIIIIAILAVIAVLLAVLIVVLQKRNVK